jgi:DNA modification methylase
MAPVGYLDTGVIYCDDNLHRLSQFPAESIDLIYLDPPFFSNRQYEVIWGDEAEVRSFEDRWEGGIHVYVEWMRERLMELHRILKPTGSMYLHCDSHASHYLKVVMDDLFGEERFRNEIIWRRYGAHNDVGQGSRHFGRVHDVILFYAKGSTPTWDQLFVPLDPKYIEQTYRHIDPDTNRRFATTPLTGPGGAAKGNPVFEWKGHTRAWRYSRETLERLDAEGKLYYSRTGYPRQKLFLDQSRGVPVQDVWDDIPSLSGAHRERLGYPTQKPIALMERILSASSGKGEIVLDPFCGCGTTLVAAQRLGRQWIGIDISPTAVDLMKRRLTKEGAAEVKLVGMPVTEDQLKALKPFEFQNWVINRMNGTHSTKKSGDMGIDGFSFMLHEPIQVKQSSGIGRNVVDNFETAVKRDGKTKGYIVAFSFGKGAYEEAARVKGADGLTIELLTIADLLKGKADLVTPETGIFGAEVPLPQPRPAETRPSVEELVESDTANDAGTNP